MRIIRYDPTPNPNAIKAVLDRESGPPLPPPLSTRSFRSQADAAGEPLAAALLNVPGVNTILLGPGWLTINKLPDTPWKGIKRGVERALLQAG